MVLSSLSNNNQLKTAAIIYWVLSLGQALCLVLCVYSVILNLKTTLYLSPFHR